MKHMLIAAAAGAAAGGAAVYFRARYMFALKALFAKAEAIAAADAAMIKAKSEAEGTKLMAAKAAKDAADAAAKPANPA